MLAIIQWSSQPVFVTTGKHLWFRKATRISIGWHLGWGRGGRVGAQTQEISLGRGIVFTSV